MRDSIPLVFSASTTTSGIKAELAPLVQRRIPENARNSSIFEIPVKSENFRPCPEKVPHFRSFPRDVRRRSRSPIALADLAGGLRARRSLGHRSGGSRVLRRGR